jgi:penicillin-insensitive murein endopeptidase
MVNLPRRLGPASALLSLLSLMVAPARAGATPAPAGWGAIAQPTEGPAQVIGHYGSACITGAVPLPLDGPGYQALDTGRHRFYGHPVLVSVLHDLGSAVQKKGLGTMLVGDMAQPRGGPMSSGHVSHQGGLDVDVWFRLPGAPLPAAEREGPPQPSVVDPATGRPDPARWTARQAELVRLAALDPRVSRVFVGAAIKRDLCERSWPDRSWLRQVRPWPGHDDHLHVRLHCPAGSPACVEQAPLPPGDGCRPGDLAPWFARERLERHRPPPLPNRVVPAACLALLPGRAAPAVVLSMKGRGQDGHQGVGGGAGIAGAGVGGTGAGRGGTQHSAGR